MKKNSDRHQFDFTMIEKRLSEKGYSTICGVDEVGRGPLAGPVVAAAVILPDDLQIEGIDDSKKLSVSKRERIFDEIINSKAICAIGIIDNETIDTINILKASLMAMRKAVMELKSSPDFILVDGSFPIPHLDYPQFSIVGGDGHCKSIGAASIIAKVTRDKIMCKYEALYPSFSFSKHKGYPTADHMKELNLHGVTEIHRRSFKPVAELLQDEYVLV